MSDLCDLFINKLSINNQMILLGVSNIQHMHCRTQWSCGIIHLYNPGRSWAYIDIFYRIVRLLRTVFGNGKGFGSILTHNTVKFINFRSMNHRFQFESIYPQESGAYDK